MVIKEIKILAVITKTCSPMSVGYKQVVWSFGLVCDIKYIILLHLSGCRSGCAMPVLTRDTPEALVSLFSTLYDTCLPFEQAKGGIFGSQLEPK